MTEAKTTNQQTTARAPALQFDAAAYIHFLDGCDWTEAQKLEFTEALWQIVCQFVDLGFGLHPVQEATASKTLDVDSPSMLALDGISDSKDESAAAAFELAAGRTDS